MRSERSLAAAALVTLAAASAGAAPARRPPDPRRGERLDGRAPPCDPRRTAMAVPRLVLGVPRLAAAAVFFPVLEATELAERHHLYERAYWALTSDDRLVGLRPDAAFVSGFAPSAGLRFFHHRVLGPASSLELRGRSAGRDIVETALHLESNPYGPFPFAIHATYDRRDDALFAGTRGQTDAELAAEGRGQARYAFDRGVLALAHPHRFSRALTVTAEAGLDLRDYGRGDPRSGDPSIEQVFCAAPGQPGCMAVDAALVPGFDEGLRLVRGGATLRLETRRGGRRTGGALVVVHGDLAHGIAGDPTDDATAVLDARWVFDLGGDRAFVVRGRASLVERLGDAPVPFEELRSASGVDGVRALPLGRLRGRSELVGTLEHRWLVATWLDAQLFGDLGGAFGARFADLGRDRLIPSVGFGLRAFHPRTEYWLGEPIGDVQLAWAPTEGEVRLLLTFGE